MNKTTTSVNATNSTKNKEIQNLLAKVKINQAKIQGLTKEDNTLEKQIPALLKHEKYNQVKDLIASIKHNQSQITNLEKQDKNLETLIKELRGN